MLRFLLAIWGVVGVLLILGSAVAGLTPHISLAFESDLQWYHKLALLACLLIMAYSEGYKGFQKAFSPRVAARARYLRVHQGPWWHFALAPLFCVGYFYAPKSRRIAAVVLFLGILLLVLAVGQLSQPWRGIVDAGVVIGLVWGMVSTSLFAIKAFTSADFPHSPELPEGLTEQAD